jgi:hypothetical protein
MRPHETLLAVPRVLRDLLPTLHALHELIDLVALSRKGGLFLFSFVIYELRSLRGLLEFSTPRAQPPDGQRLIAIDPARVAVEEAREAGPVYVGHQMWRELGLSQILARAGLAE